MGAWREQPVIYEVNAWVWLHELGCRFGAVPPDAWDDLALPGVDAVWFMGVWRRSPAGVAIARADEALLSSFAGALGDLHADDIVGSPYCIRDYVVDEHLGGPDGLATARAELARRGVRLLLDFVPNHVAPDHPWTSQHPERFVRGTAADVAADPTAFLEVSGNVFARGRDPFFAPWQDVLQLNAFDPGLRDAAADTLVAIGDQCDGVRCDMAMLVLNEVFTRTWGDRAGSVPADDFWPDVLPRVRRRHPEMLFVAEAYWDLEAVLQDQGFDHCYDKLLYDRLRHGDAGSVREHLRADPDEQRHRLRFTENHDEPRAAAAFEPGRLRAAAVATATLPGASLWHEGQLEGRRVQLPVFLGRRPVEPADDELRRFHHRLLAAVSASAVRSGTWRLLEPTGWPDNDSHRHLVAYAWDDDGGRHVVVVNLSPGRVQARIPLPWPDLHDAPVDLVELLDGALYRRDGRELTEAGLFVELDGWGWHLLAVEPGADR